MSNKIVKGQSFSFLLNDWKKLDDHQLVILKGQDAKWSMINGSGAFDIYDDKEYLCIVHTMTCSSEIHVIAEVKDYEQ